MYKDIVAILITAFLFTSAGVYMDSKDGVINSYLFTLVIAFALYYGVYTIVRNVLEWAEKENELSKLKGE